MLNVFRSSANNGVMLLILLAIGFVFVFTFGSWGGGNVSGDLPVAATVNGKVIPLSQFRVQYAQSFRTQSMFRPGFNADRAREESLDQQVLDRLIQTEVLAQAAEERGLAVADKEVADAIQERFFGKDKAFDVEEYKRLVNGIYNTTEARFEVQLRRELLAERMEAVLADAQPVPESELRESFLQKNDRADLEFVKLDPAFFKAEAKAPSEDEVKAWVADNKGEVEKFYNEHINRYRQGKKVDARHILIKAAASASDEDKKAARARIEDAKRRVDGGEDFAKVATEVSEDGSAAQGGSLGLFGEGAMVKPFQDAAFALKKGEVSGIVETRFGFHVIKVEDIQEASIQELAAVELDIGKQLVSDARQLELARAAAAKVHAELAAGKAMHELTLPGLLKPGPDGAPPAMENADPAAPRVESTGLFAKSARIVPRVGVAPSLVELAFNSLTTDAPLAKEPVEINGRLFVVRLKERERPDESRFAAERTALEQELMGNRRTQVVDTFVKGRLEKARISKNPRLLDNRS